MHSYFKQCLDLTLKYPLTLARDYDIELMVVDISPF
jgi:hypothetical protein